MEFQVGRIEDYERYKKRLLKDFNVNDARDMHKLRAKMFDKKSSFSVLSLIFRLNRTYQSDAPNTTILKKS